MMLRCRKILASLAAVFSVILFAVSCDKDKEADSLPSLEGSLRFDCPSFVAPKQVVTMRPTGVKHPEG